MEYEEIEIGMHVLIKSIFHTERHIGIDDEMRPMVGRVYEVFKKQKSFGDPMITAGGFYWHPNDLLHMATDRKESQKFHFDTGELI